MTASPLSGTPSSGGGRSPEEQFRVVRKRNRVPLSCFPCRTRKLKCDRSHPCSNCTKREGTDTLVCSYATPSSRKKAQNQGGPGSDDMQNRIDRLEGLVLSLMHGGANVDVSPTAAAGTVAATAHSTTDSGSSARLDAGDDSAMPDEEDEDSDTDDGLATSLGVLKVDADKGKSMYIGQEHWHTLLADIAEVKNYYTAHKKDLEKSYEKVLLSKPPSSRDGPTFLLGAIPATEVELRAELPPKSTVLTLCGRYFNSMDNAVNIIHAPTFHQTLRGHWQDPSKTPIMWLGLLYSIMSLAMLSYYKVGDEPAEWKGRTLDLAAEYRLRTVQCLIAGDYTRPSEYTVETMMLYIFGEFSSRWDADLGLWLISSLATRTAFRMGYHRDAKWFPSITPFQAEMRRRTWALVRLSDVIFSHQVSLPNMIYEHDCDTQLPNNLFDEEFGPETKVLPPSRPNAEPTPISYMIHKVKLCSELGNILQATSRIRNQVHYDEILRFDAKLREIKAELPPHLKLQPLDGNHDPLTLVIARFNIDILYLKIMCLLHRKYMSRARHNPRYAHSRRSAIEASLEALRHLAVLHRESEPGGRLRSIKWFITSIATRDFLLPAMLIVLDLHFDSEVEKSGERRDSHNVYFWTREQRQEMIRSLETTHEIWKGMAEGSNPTMEAVKASKVLEIMLEKTSKSSAGSPSQATAPTNANMFRSMGANNMQPEHSAAVTLGMLSGGVSVPGSTSAAESLLRSSPGISMGNPAFDLAFGSSGSGSGSGSGMTPDFSGDMLGGDPGAASPFSMFNMAGNNMDFPGNFDWESFETYAQTGNFGPVEQSIQFFSNNGDPSQPNGMPDGNMFSFGDQNMPNMPGAG
ncbi:fungal-specific transcription factor domain-containing protein [Cercophora newfieldiana]|uniref:Fungal-specific transcription factor domain-containing protein n=1 Tax=Cercophora newfieldiana TaxID=92897 RepID=A0AA40D0V3_9PEZI|nr:fungal-specific transcription factor domain-containing protein [Cercophora newfieldiana]